MAADPADAGDECPVDGDTGGLAKFQNGDDDDGDGGVDDDGDL